MAVPVALRPVIAESCMGRDIYHPRVSAPTYLGTFRRAIYVQRRRAGAEPPTAGSAGRRRRVHGVLHLDVSGGDCAVVAANDGVERPAGAGNNRPPVQSAATAGGLGFSIQELPQLSRA